jgi:hypothetical protein
MTVITRNGSIVLKFDDKENCPLDQLLAAKLGTPPLELENLEELLRNNGLVEMVRTGVVALGCGNKTT